MFTTVLTIYGIVVVALIVLACVYLLVTGKWKRNDNMKTFFKSVKKSKRVETKKA